MALHGIMLMFSIILPIRVHFATGQEGSCDHTYDRFDLMYAKCLSSNMIRLRMDDADNPQKDGPQWLIRVPESEQDGTSEIYAISIAWQHLYENGHANVTLDDEGQYRIVATMEYGNSEKALLTLEVPANFTTAESVSNLPASELKYIKGNIIPPFTAQGSRLIAISLSLIDRNNQSVSITNEQNACPECVELWHRVYLKGCEFEKSEVHVCLYAYKDWKNTLETAPPNCYPDYVVRNLDERYAHCFVAPSFTQVSGFVKTYVGESATLVCISDGSPEPTIRWYKGDRLLELHAYKNHIYIHNTNWRHQGRYICEADNVVQKVNSTVIHLQIYDRPCRNYKVKEDKFLQECSNGGKYRPNQMSWPEFVTTTADSTLMDIGIDNALFHERSNEYDSYYDANYTDDGAAEVHCDPGDDGRLVSFIVRIVDVTQGDTATSAELGTLPGNTPSQDGVVYTPGEVSTSGAVTLSATAATGETLSQSSSTRGRFDNRGNWMSRGHQQPTAPPGLRRNGTSKGRGEDVVSRPPVTQQPVSENVIFTKTFENVFSAKPNPYCMEETETLLVLLDSATELYVPRGRRLRIEIRDTDGRLLEKQCDGDTCSSLGYRTFQTDCNVTTSGQCLSAYFQWKNILSGNEQWRCVKTAALRGKLEHCESTVLPKAQLHIDGSHVTLVDERKLLSCDVSGDPSPSVQWLLNSMPLEDTDGAQYNFTKSHTGDYRVECKASNIFGTAKSNAVTLTVVGQEFCPEEFAAGLTWPRTSRGQETHSLEKCPSGINRAKATRNCFGNSTHAWWGRIERQSCGQNVDINNELQKLTEVKITENNVESVATQLSELTAAYANFTTSGVTDTADVLVNIIASTNSSTVSGEIINSLNNLMQVDHETLGESQQTAKSAQKTILALENYLEKVELGEGRRILHEVGTQIAYEIIEDEPAAFGDGVGFVSLVESDGEEDGSDLSILNMPSPAAELKNLTDASISIPASILHYSGNSSSKVRFTFVIYQTDALFQSNSLSGFSSDNEEVTMKVNSRIIGGSLAKREVENLTEPITVKFLPTEFYSEAIINTSQCVYWDFDANNGYGDWSSEGCYFIGIEDSRVVCQCYHLTNFAVLMNVHGNQPEAIHLFALDTISKIGCLLSIIGLVLTLATYLGFRKLRKTRAQRILINLCIALLCLMLVFLAGIDQTHSYWGCITVAILLHFFTLAAFMWMGIEAFNMYMAFIRVMPMYISYFMIKVGVVAWGLPLLAVVITLSLGLHNYTSNKDYCFMDHNAFYYAYVIPIALVLLYNLVVYTLVIRQLCAKSHATTVDKPQHLHMRWQIRNSVCILLILGLTWTFAFFAVDKVTLLFQYLFCVFNSLQGFFIFVFYCLDQRDAREQWRLACGFCPCLRKKKKKYKYRSPGFDLIYHNPTYTTSQSHRSSVSSAKQFSLSPRESTGTVHQATQTSAPQPNFVQ